MYVVVDRGYLKWTRNFKANFNTVLLQYLISPFAFARVSHNRENKHIAKNTSANTPEKKFISLFYVCVTAHHRYNNTNSELDEIIIIIIIYCNNIYIEIIYKSYWPHYTFQCLKICPYLCMKLLRWNWTWYVVPQNSVWSNAIN